MPQRRLPGLPARGPVPGEAGPREIRGATTIVELLRLYPDGAAGRLLSELSMPCAHCGGAFNEPLTLAAKRHRRDPRAVLEAFRALADGGPGGGRHEKRVVAGGGHGQAPGAPPRVTLRPVTLSTAGTVTEAPSPVAKSAA